MKRETIAKTLLFVGALVAFGMWQIWEMWSANYPVTNFPPKGNTIVAFGDSLTEGVGASSPEKGYVAILEKRLNITIINKGVRGDTTELALARLPVDVLQLHPNIVIILLGGNDIIQHVPRTTTFAHLKTIIERTQRSGAVVVLIGINGLLGNAYENDFAKLAKATKSIYIPNALDGITGNSALLADEVHPNDAGYLKVADKIAPILEGLALAIQNESTTTSQ